MADDEDEDLYDEEFDFVDDDDDLEDEEREEESSADDSDLADEPARVAPRQRERARVDEGDAQDTFDRGEADDANEPVDEYGRPEPAANYVVHLYEAKKFTRTIDRPFTPEDAEAFASEFNRTGKNYGRFAVTGKNDAKPKKTLD